MAHLSNKIALPKKYVQKPIGIDVYKKAIYIKTATVTGDINSEIGCMTQIQKKNKKVLVKPIHLSKSSHIHEKKLDETTFNFDDKVRDAGSAACVPNLAERYQVTVNKLLSFNVLLLVE